MSKVDHELMELLEYKGEYGARYNCKGCIWRKGNDDYSYCEKQKIDVHCGNNVCREYKPRIVNPSAPIFNLDDYLEFLFSDYYRPYRMDLDIIVGSISKTAYHIELDNGKLAQQSPKQWQPYYKIYSLPYCRVNCGGGNYVKINDNIFKIDYKRFRELKTIENGKIEFIIRQWKDKPRQRKYSSETNGTYIIE